MKTADLALLIIVGVIFLIVVVMVTMAFIRHSAGVNRTKHKAVLDITDQFANDIEDSVEALGDLEHPLAAKIRTLVRTYRKDIREL